jgi:hypothetical protein
MQGRLEDGAPTGLPLPPGLCLGMVRWSVSVHHQVSPFFVFESGHVDFVRVSPGIPFFWKRIDVEVNHFVLLK